MLQSKILSTIRKYSLFSSLDRVLVGVSGGPDSLVLLYLLDELKVKLGIKIIVAHLNHGLRGKSSDSDERFVETIANNLGLDFLSKKIKWPSSKSNPPNEETLRKLRYNFLFELAKRHKVNKVALAHTLDDQAETVLMRIIRGAGLYGLISILPKRKIESFISPEKGRDKKSFLTEFTVIRPMIEISRDEIEDYLKTKRIKARIDKTNFNRVFLRNKIRHGVLRDLNKLNPNIKQSLARLAQQAAIDYDYLHQRAKRLVNFYSDSTIKVDLKKFRNLHTALQRMVVRVALERITGTLRTFTSRHWDEIQNLVNLKPYGSIVHLTKDIHIKKDKQNIVIYAKKR